MSTALEAGRQVSGRDQGLLPIDGSKVTLQRLLISLSIANLYFLTMWQEILGLAGSGNIKYFEAHPPEMKLLWALIADILILSAILLVSLRMRDKKAAALRIAGTALLTFCCLFALYNLQRSLNESLHHLVPEGVSGFLKVAATIPVLFLVSRFPQRALRAMRLFFLVLSPLFGVLALNGFWVYHTPDLQTLNQGAAAGMLPVHGGASRVIWIIFDELDQKMLFDSRPKGIELPEFDRFRAEAIYADHVKSPAWDTVVAIPALLLGRVVKETKQSASDLWVKSNDGHEWVDFKSQPNVFSRARAAGFNTAISGCHHPYCRLLGNSLSACVWAVKGADAVAIKRFLDSKTTFYVALYLANWQLHQIPLLQSLRWINAAPELSAIVQGNDIDETRLVSGNALKMLENRNLDLVFLHFPVPHPPGIWDVKKQTFTTGNSNYIDNLQLCDKLLGEMRHVLEQIGDWDRSTILISGDHPYRAYLWGSPDLLWSAPDMRREKTQPYVPFLLKLPGQHDEFPYHREFNSVVSADLLLEALFGQLKTPLQAMEFLDGRAPTV